MKKIMLPLVAFLVFFSANTFAHSYDTNEKPIAIQLRTNDTVGLIAPSFRSVDESKIDEAVTNLKEFGLNVKLGDAIYITRRIDGPHPGNNEERAADINNMISDPEVKAIFLLKGGGGCSQLLDLIDYDAIVQNPKIFMGFSDATSLLLGINSKTDLPTFYGSMPAVYSWNNFSKKYIQDILFDGKKITLTNSADAPITTINGGAVTGRLEGGNFATLNSIVGSKYLPNFKGNILFVEDINEEFYKIDRMFAQLKLAGILDDISGFVFGMCTKCKSGGTPDHRTVLEIIEKHILPLDIPAYYGAMISHEENIFVVPMGTMVKMDADAGTIEMLEPAVKHDSESGANSSPDHKDEL